MKVTVVPESFFMSYLTAVTAQTMIQFLMIMFADSQDIAVCSFVSD